MGDFTVITDGYVLYKFTDCLHSNGYSQIGDFTYKYKTIITETQPTHTSVQFSHGHLARLLNVKADRPLLEGLEIQDALDHRTYDLLAELNALVDNTQTKSLANVLQDQNRLPMWGTQLAGHCFRKSKHFSLPPPQ